MTRLEGQALSCSYFALLADCDFAQTQVVVLVHGVRSATLPASGLLLT